MQRFAQDGHHEAAEYDQGDRFLRDLQLTWAPAAGEPNAICGYGETIFDERDAPTD